MLACLWIERGLGAAPTEFAVLVERLVTEPGLKAAIRTLVGAKKAGRELDRGPRIPAISEFLDEQLSRFSAEDEPPAITRDPGPLDALFVESLIEVNGTPRRRSPSRRA